MRTTPTISTLKCGHQPDQDSRGRCRRCVREAQAAYRARPEIAARDAARRKSPEARAYWATWRAENLERARSYSRKHQHKRRLRENFGLTVAQFQAMSDAQGGLCAICGETPSHGRVLVVDHDHETGQVRGLLCTACNLGIGNLNDDPDRLTAALAYLLGGRPSPQ